MRMLHTADWHVGRTMRGKSRVAEFEAVLGEIIDIARHEEVETMLVCGDVWDHHAPSAESDRVVFEALRECVNHGIQVVLLAGNHDNPRKFRALGLLSEMLGVHTVSRALHPNAGGIITIDGKRDVARIVAAPFITEGSQVKAAALMDLPHERYSRYSDGVAAVYASMCQSLSSQTANVFASHVFINEARLSVADGSERKLHVGPTYAVAAAQLPTSPQYCALGHIHEPQEIVDAPVPTTYSGSILQLDFGERGQTKSVRIVDVVPGERATHYAVPLTSGTPLIEVAGGIDDVLRSGTERSSPAHIRVRLDIEHPEPGIVERIRDAVPGVVDVRLNYEQQPDAARHNVDIDAMTDTEMYTRYYLAQYGREPTPEIVALFEQILADADEEARGGNTEQPDRVALAGGVA